MPGVSTRFSGDGRTPALPPVATPFRYRWRAFRSGLLPGIIFLGCVLGIAGLWQYSVAPPTFVAEAEALRTEVGPSHPGRITTIEVSLLQSVKAGDILSRVAVAPPAVAAASLAVIRAELDLLRTSLGPAVEPQRAALDFSRLQLDWMRERVTLASLRAQVQLAEVELRRTTALREQRLVSEESFDVAKNLHDRLVAQMSAQADLVATLAPVAQHPVLAAAPVADTVAAGLRVQEEKLRCAELQLSPELLVAPIDGVVTGLHRQVGETVAAGQAIVTVVAHRPARLVGFLRQPLPWSPRRGAPVELRTRSSARLRAAASIVEIGHALEPVPATILGLVNRSGSPELGLRVHLSIPPQWQLHPGEQVDVLLAGSDSVASIP
jgi:multidrug resistance efflux pump